MRQSIIKSIICRIFFRRNKFLQYPIGFFKFLRRKVFKYVLKKRIQNCKYSFSLYKIDQTDIFFFFYKRYNNFYQTHFLLDNKIKLLWLKKRA